MHVEQKTLEQKNHDLAEAFREKSKNQQQLQKLYQQLKQEQLAAGMELAAEHDADHVLRAAGLGQYAKTNTHASHQAQVHSGSNGSGSGSGGRIRNINSWENQPQGSRAGLGTARKQPCHSSLEFTLTS
jgi:E3 ubiquitin-protein ligase CCNP1IP1